MHTNSGLVYFFNISAIDLVLVQFTCYTSKNKIFLPENWYILLLVE